MAEPVAACVGHFWFVKRVSALLFDQTKNSNVKHFCIMSLTGLTRADLLVNHKKLCKGVKDRPTTILMPKKGEDTLSFRNFNKQTKAAFIVYADFEALIKKIPGCGNNPGVMTSFTQKTEVHEACGFSLVIVRSDGKGINGKTPAPVVYRGETPAETFLEAMLEEEAKIREELADPQPPVMTKLISRHSKTRRNVTFATRV